MLSSMPMSRLLVLALMLAACGKDNAPSTSSSSATTTASTSAKTEARRIFTSKCQMCHGPEGRGDGPMANSLNPRPRDFHSPSFQSAVTDQQILAIIEKGGAAVGKSAAMTANPDLDPATLAALKDLVRGFAPATSR